MESKRGFLHQNVPCPSCNQLHDLFVIDETAIEQSYRFTCPHTKNFATWLCDRAAEIVQDQPHGAIHAVREEE
jgi:hypothetical protein